MCHCMYVITYEMLHTHALEPGNHWGVDFADQITLGGFKSSPARVRGWNNFCFFYIRNISVTYRELFRATAFKIASFSPCFCYRTG